MEKTLMNDQLWALFRETGDPVGYLLYKKTDGGAGKTREKKQRPKPPEAERRPTASL